MPGLFSRLSSCVSSENQATISIAFSAANRLMESIWLLRSMTSPDGVRMLSVVYAIALIICYPYKEPAKAEWPYSTLSDWK